jgi:predicted MFS family arabinose efflux permease
VSGDFFSFIAVSWLTLQITGSALALGTVLTLQGIPRASLMILGGALTDRLSAQRLMSISAFGRALLMAAFAIDVGSAHVQLWHVYFYSVLLGSLGAFFLPAQATILPRVVPTEMLEAGNAAINIGTQAARVIAPAVAGLVVARFGSAPAFAIDGACFLLCAVAVLQLRLPVRLSTASEGLLRSVGAGFAYVWRDHALMAVFAVVVALNFALAGPMQIGLILISRQRFAGASSLGLILAANATGSVLGTLVAGTVRPRRLGLVFIFIPLATAGISALLGATTVLPVAAALMLLFGSGTGVINVITPAWLQRRTEPAMLGRVMALANTAALGAVPLSQAVAGVIGQVSVVLLFLFSAATQAMAAGTAATSRSFRRI